MTLSPSTDAKVILAKSSRPANEFEREGATGSEWVANLALRPEGFRTYEVSVSQGLGRRAQLTAAGFVSRISGLISLVVRPEDGATQYQNAETIDSRGLEIELSGKWRSGLTARASYSLQSTTNAADGRRLTNSPRHLLKGNVLIPLLGERVTAGLETQYTSARLSLQGREAGGFLLTNLTVLAHAVPGRLDVSASAYNLFDRSFAEPGGPEHRQDLIAQDGRSVLLKLTVRF
jgi:iron complex outermembrane receptor protein